MKRIVLRVLAGTTSRAWHGPTGFVAIAVLNVVCYWVFFTRRAGLLALYRRPLLNLYDVTQQDPAARLWLIAGFTVLGALYWLGLRMALRAQGRILWTAAVGGALAAAAILLFRMPIGAADIFDNIMHGRILGVYGANPFHDVTRQFPADLFYPYTAWRDAPSAYGPGWEALAALAARLAGNGVVANVIAFKLLGGLFLAISAGLVVAILRRQAPEWALAGFVLLAWNPVVLVETLGEGHNDMAMMAWVLVAVWLLAGRRYTAAILALVIGGLFKFVPVLLLPAAVALALRDLPGRRARLSFLVTTGALAALLVIAAYGPFWHGPDTLGIKRRQALFTASLPATIYVLAAPRLGQAAAARGVSLAAAALAGAFAIWQGARAVRDRSWLAFPRAAFNILVFYLLVACPWYQSWYAIWPLALAALAPAGRAARFGALFTYVALAKPLLFAPAWLWIRPLPSVAWREVRLGPAVLALPWLYVFLAWWGSRRPLRSRRGEQLETHRRPADHRQAASPGAG